VTGAVAGEWGAIPVGPPLEQFEAGETGHEVEFGRPGVAPRDRLVTGRAVDGEPVVRCAGLGGCVDLVDADVVVAHVAQDSSFAREQTA